MFLKGLANVNESVEIDLRMICECDCEKSERIIPNSKDCSNAGTFACGICFPCSGIRTGDRCECDPQKPINASDPESHCKNEGILQIIYYCFTQYFEMSTFNLFQ